MDHRFVMEGPKLRNVMRKSGRKRWENEKDSGGKETVKVC